MPPLPTTASKSFFGAGENKHTLTGVRLRGSRLTGAACVAGLTVCPRVMAEADADDPADDAPVEGEGAPEIVTFGSQEWQGRRLPYRKGAPEHWRPAKRRQVLERTARALGGLMPIGAAGVPHEAQDACS